MDVRNRLAAWVQRGPQRREALENAFAAIGDKASYYLGPHVTGAATNALNVFNAISPGADVRDAYEASGDLMDWRGPMDAATDAATLGAAFGSMLLPGGVSSYKQGFDDLADELARGYDPNTLNAFRVFHGSPHDFDKFSMDRIGTGEGAQAYGHGLYFAENPAVAKDYHTQLTDPDFAKLTVGGRQINTVWVDELRETFPDMYKGLSESDAYEMDALLGTLESAYSLEDAENAVRSIGSRAAERLFRQRVKPTLRKPDLNAGGIYEAMIDAEPEDFLDWDAPLSEQPEKVRDFFVDSLRPDNQQAAEWNFEYFKERGAQNPTRVHEFRDATGVQGIRYYDQGSREAGGTRNYVVFDENLIDITAKDGIPRLRR